jgi:glutaredoxin
MVLRVFYISTTGRRDIRKRQIHVFAVLSSWKFDYEAIDVAAPEHEEDRDFVIESGKKTDDGKMILPQIFKEEECCGDYLDFLQAIEHEKLQLFLKQITQEEFDALEKSRNGEKEETKEEEKAEGEEEEDTEKKEDEEETEKKEDEETEDGEKEEKTADDEENKEEGDETTKGK